MAASQSPYCTSGSTIGLAAAQGALGLRWSSVLTFLAAVGPVVARVVMHPAELGRSDVRVALSASAAFMLLFSVRLGSLRTRILLLVGFAAAAIAALPFPLPNAPTLVLLQVMVASILPLLGSARLAVVVLLLQLIVLAPVYQQWIGGPVYLLTFLAAIGGLQMFAYHFARLHEREAATSAELRRALSTLEVTRSVLAAGERLGERVRIARDLHDAVGHHLTTLSLQIDLARRQPPEPARKTLDTAHSICRLLLTELRDVLQDVRRTDGPELAAALREMIAHVPELEVHLDAGADLGSLDPDRAHLLLRCGQEFLTNTLRHAGARRLDLRLALQGSAGDRVVVLQSEDDGRGFQSRRTGGGLDAIEARLIAFGGALRTTGRGDGRGLRLEAVLPLPEARP